MTEHALKILSWRCQRTRPFSRTGDLAQFPNHKPTAAASLERSCTDRIRTLLFKTLI